MTLRLGDAGAILMLRAVVAVLVLGAEYIVLVFTSFRPNDIVRIIC